MAVQELAHGDARAEVAEGVDVDLSGVQCGCNAAVYLAHMTQIGGKPNYCDAWSEPSCLEIDMLEGNAKALQATLDGGEYDADGKAAGEAMGAILAEADRLASAR